VELPQDRLLCALNIRAAAEKSLAERVIRKLPRGYEQVLGSRFEGSVDLSGGEWQKIALARAYLRDAQLLILDEPTAALDARSEHEFERFAELTRGKISVLISHRFLTVRMADRILVLDNAKIAEQGPHHELLKNGDAMPKCSNFKRRTIDDKDLKPIRTAPVLPKGILQLTAADSGRLELEDG